MELLALLGIAALVAAVIVPWIAYSKASTALAELRQTRDALQILTKRVNEAVAQIALLKQRTQPPPQEQPTREVAASAAKSAVVSPEAVVVAAREPVESESATPKPASETPSLAVPSSRAPTPRTAPIRPAPPPRKPSDVELQLAKWLAAGKEWLFGGNLVAKVGLLILFIGVAFLVRFASNYVTVPVELRLAGVAAGAIALLVWAWRIRESRRGIALPAQGAALAILMLVTFGAFKLFHVLPSNATFGLLFVLVAFTCVLAVLQDAMWLAVFGIAGGFAAPVLISTGGGSHVALFSYYCLLNAGVLAIALKRSWRLLNLLGFAFTFVVAAAWGEQRYVPEHYLSSQLFLVTFWLFYIAIAVLFAWRRAPQLKSYVDGTLVFGVPMAGMALQYGLVKDIRYGMSLSALCVALTYASTATGLWRWRQGTLRLLVESFLALGIVFGTLAIPLAFDGRWTSAAWAVEGAAIVWIGLKQKQTLAWQFGVAVQLGSWVAFASALAGLDPIAALKHNIGLGFLVLGVTGVVMALLFRRHVQSPSASELEQRSRERFGWLASSFVTAAVVWLLLGMWVEVWLRMHGAQRATLLVATALALVFGLQFLAKRSTWSLPQVLGGGVAAVAGVAFAGLMMQHMEWRNVAVYTDESFGKLLGDGPLLGGFMLCGGALLSAFAFKNRLALLTAARESSTRITSATASWFLAAVFWWCGFVLHGLAHALAYLSSAYADTPWYAISFWAAYGVGLALSALAWTHLATRKQFPRSQWIHSVLWPTLTAAGGFIYWKQVNDTVWWTRHDWRVLATSSADALLNLASGPLIGALLLCALAWHGVRTTRSHAGRGIAVWLIGLGLLWYLLAVDSLALFAATLLRSVGLPHHDAGWQLAFAHNALLLATASGMVFLWLAKRTQTMALRWLALPSAALQAATSAIVLWALFLQGRLPAVGTSIAMIGCWLGMVWCLRYWQRNEWPLPTSALKTLHFGRVIAPWLAIAPLISLSTWQWLTGETPEQMQTLFDSGWVVAGKWPDYLAAWVSIATLMLLLRQARSSQDSQGGWPLRPLHAWYAQWLIPLATLWGVLLAVYWNLRQDGNMSPLPYLPLLNPLDITTGFVALLVASVWRTNKIQITPQLHRLGVKASLALAFAWLNLMLLRTAAQYLPLPYRYHSLYNSQFVQAMLSIVWTLTAFVLMRYAVRTLSKPLWMVGAGLLAVVVAKLALVDLSNSGSIARIVSFMGVGGLMLVIGYLAPLPRRDSGAAQETP